MSKQDLENQDAAPETSAESQPTVTSIPNGWATSPVELLTLNVNEHTEKKNNLTYLSWAWAWAEALKADPTTNFMHNRVTFKRNFKLRLNHMQTFCNLQIIKIT